MSNPETTANIKFNEQGFVVNEDGQPFETQKDLKARMKEYGFLKYSIVNVDDDRYAAHVETYWWVKFQQRTSENETPDVELIVNGETLLLQRDKRVPVPARFLEEADHTTYTIYKQIPGHDRKVPVTVKLFPYERFGQATEEEYKTFLRDGTKKSQEIYIRYGADVDPASLEA